MQAAAASRNTAKVMANENAEGVVSVKYAVDSPTKAQSVLDGIDLKYFNPDSRFGR